MSRRHARVLSFACSLALAATVARGQALADRVPADAIAYAGWAGADAVAAQAKGTHLEAVLAESRMRELFRSYLDQCEAKAVAAEPKSKEAFRVFRALATPLWREPTAVAFAPPVRLANGRYAPRVTLLVQAGAADAGGLVAELQKHLDQLPKDAAIPVRAFTAGDLACLAIGYDAPEKAAVATGDGATLAADAALANVAARKPAVAYFFNVEAGLKAIGEAVQENAPDSAPKFNAFVDASGLRGVRRYVSTSGFDGKDWASESFVDAPAPRSGLLSVFGDGTTPLAPELLNAVPANASTFVTARFDAAKAIRETQNALGKTDPGALKQFNMGLGVVYQVFGTNVLTNLLDPLGTDWAAYSAPETGGGGLLGFVAVNQLRDPEKFRKAMATASFNLTQWINIATRKAAEREERPTPIVVHGARTKVGDVDVYYLALPLVAPSWAVKDGRLYLGLYPQTVGAAARRATTGESIADSAPFQATLKRLNAPANATPSYVDLPKVAAYGDSYGQLLALTRYAGLGDLFGVTFPEPFLPPMDTLMANLAPAAGASWQDEKGFHTKRLTPFPGAALVAPGGAFSSAGVGGSALMASVLLPALNNARESANRVKSASNLRQIGLAMMLYTNEHKGAYPDDFAPLLASEDVTPQVFVSPRTNTTLPAGHAEALKFAAEHSDYVYLGKGRKNDASPEQIIAYENPEGLQGGVNVLYGDGHVEFVTMDNLKQQLEHQQAPAVP